MTTNHCLIGISNNMLLDPAGLAAAHPKFGLRYMLQFKRQWLLLDYGIMGYMLKIGYGGACKMETKCSIGICN